MCALRGRYLDVPLLSLLLSLLCWPRCVRCAGRVVLSRERHGNMQPWGYMRRHRQQDASKAPFFIGVCKCGVTGAVPWLLCVARSVRQKPESAKCRGSALLRTDGKRHWTREGDAGKPQRKKAQTPKLSPRTSPPPPHSLACTHAHTLWEVLFGGNRRHRAKAGGDTLAFRHGDIELETASQRNGRTRTTNTSPPGSQSAGSRQCLCL